MSILKAKYGKRKYKPWIQTEKSRWKKNNLLEEINNNDLMIKKHKKICKRSKHIVEEDLSRLLNTYLF